MHHLRATLVVALTLPAALLAAPAVAAPDGPCTDPDGVTVVVDATGLGGEVAVGCAESPATGTEALQQAGFTDVRDTAGLICAIDSLPDPCPEEFTGEYWSYWYAEDGGWQSYMEGSDTAVPAAGGVEGWRWADGGTPPEIDLATLEAEPQGDPTPTPAPTEEPAPTSTETVSEAGEIAGDDGGLPVLPIAVGGAVLLALVTVLAVRRRRG